MRKLQILQNSICRLCLCPTCRYLIRPDPLSLVPNQGSSRKCSAGLSESHRFDTQDSTHLWETKKDKYTVETLPERGKNNNTLLSEKKKLRNGEMERDPGQMAHGPSIFSTFSLGELRGAGHAWTFSIKMGMFYLCTFLFSKRRAADTEVHLMKNSMYLYQCMCMLCAASCMCSVCVCMCVLYVCVSVWMNVCVYGSRARHCQFYLDSQRNRPPTESQGMSFCCRRCVLSLNVVWRIWKWHYSAHTLWDFILWSS